DVAVTVVEIKIHGLPYQRRPAPGPATTAVAPTGTATAGAATTSVAAPAGAATSPTAATTPSAAANRRHGRCLRGSHHIRIGPAIRHQVIGPHVRGVRRELFYRCGDLPGIVRLQTLDQRGRRRARRAIGPEFVPEARREQTALRHIEG